MNWFEILTMHSPALIVAVPLLTGFLTPLVSRINDTVRNIFVLIMLSITGLLITILGYDVLTNGIRTYVFGGGNTVVTLPSGLMFHVRIIFEVDSMNVFMVIITIILAIIGIVYSLSFMKKEDGLDKYYTIVLILVASTLGMELTGDLFNFFVFLEISCITSCALIAFWVHKGEALEAALKYIVISSIAALFFLFALGLLYAQYNALNMATIANAIQFTTIDQAALVLIIAALAMKAGLVPMHMWLPDSYGEAPPSVTFILIAATQAGLYGAFRTIFTLYGNVFNSINLASLNLVITANTIGWILVALAIITILIGLFMALVQTDFKRLIAFAAVAEIGYIFLGIGVRLASKYVQYSGSNATAIAFSEYSSIALNGSIFHIINDCLDIGLLFLVAGAIYYATKESSLDKMGGLARNMKYTTIFFIIGLLAVSGMPPFNGFASKLMLYESTYQLNPIIAIIAVLASILLLAVFIKVFYSAFMGPEQSKFKEVKEVPRGMLIAMGAVAFIIIIFGLFPNLVINNIVQPAADALTNYTAYISKVIPGVI
jgi:multicomponent Na+:H+ antiporter subunit D